MSQIQKKRILIKQKANKNIVLIGLMGSGKSMVAKALEEQLGLPRFCSDELIEKQEGRSISDIVALKGWPYFRKIEHQVIKKLSTKKGAIIDCGGGVVLNPKNLALLKKNGKIFHLKANPLVLYQRLKNDTTRPLVQGPNPQKVLKAIYKERLPLYNQADLTLNASGAAIEPLVVRIIKEINK